jgi:hypothetical protein
MNFRATATMKVLCSAILSIVLFVSASLSSALSMSPSTVKKAVTGALVAASLAFTPMAANAVDFSGDYADPKHPNCKRQINVLGKTAYVSGTDGTPGCPADGSGKPWNLIGKVKVNNILVDFSPKGGPKDLEGKWEAEPVAGIRWPDGNLWSYKN